MSMQTMSWYLEAMAIVFWLVIGTGVLVAS